MSESEKCWICLDNFKDRRCLKIHLSTVGERNPAAGGGWSLSEETKQKIGEAARGREYTEEQRINMSEAQKGRNVTWGDKISASLTGRTMPQETRDKISESIPKGTDHPLGKENPVTDYVRDWESIAETIRERDFRCCRLCRTSEEELDMKLDVHHRDSDVENNRSHNLLSLCRSCHVTVEQNDVAV